MPPLSPATLGVILAGGSAQRMGGGDKPLLRLGGRTLLDRVAERLAPQCESMILNANGDPRRFQETPLAVVPDSLPDRPGPLAGILTALEWAALHRPHLAWIATVPGDTPFIPRDLVQRLHEARQEANHPLACALSGAQEHYAVGLWPVRLRHDLRDAVATRGTRSIRDWIRDQGYATAAWSAQPFDPFFNINTPHDLAQAEAFGDRVEARQPSTP